MEMEEKIEKNGSFHGSHVFSPVWQAFGTGSIWVDMKPENQNRSVLARESDGVFKACSMEKQSW
ncbi:MAG: hypothetical protein HQL81_07060 [Magnetococcales bacterium]|nr:hypothetical protein [Magnetococcales bacterium]